MSVRYYRPDEALPEGICPGCRSAALPAARDECQACGVVRTLRPQSPRAWPDLSHGQPGHMCVLPAAPQHEAEAG
jgi:hypothetical protein